MSARLTLVLATILLLGFALGWVLFRDEPDRGSGRVDERPSAAPHEFDPVAEVAPAPIETAGFRGEDLPGGPGSISGLVRDASGEVAAGARIIVRPVDDEGRSLAGWRDARTTGSGRFVLRDLPLGAYSVDATWKGFSATITSPCRLRDEGPAASVELVLDRGLTLEGRVVDVGDAGIAGVPIEVCTVIDEVVDPVPLRRAESGRDGRFSVPGLRRGASYALGLGTRRWRLPGGAVIVERFQGDEVRRLRVWRNASVRGVVIDDRARPVPGAEVEIDHGRATVADAAGRFCLEGLGPTHENRCVLWGADAARRSAGKRELRIRDGEDLEGIELQLHPLGRLAGRVRCAGSMPEAVTVAISPPDIADPLEPCSEEAIANLLARQMTATRRPAPGAKARVLHPARVPAIPEHAWPWLSRLRRADDVTGREAIETGVRGHPRAYRRELPRNLVALSRSDEWQQEELEEEEESISEEATPVDAEYRRRYGHRGRYWLRRSSGSIGWRHDGESASTERRPEIAHEMTRRARRVECDGAGRFVAAGLWPGEYALVATAAGRSIVLPPAMAGVATGEETGMVSLAVAPPRRLVARTTGIRDDVVYYLRGPFGRFGSFRARSTEVLTLDAFPAGDFTLEVRAGSGYGVSATPGPITWPAEGGERSVVLELDETKAAALHVWLSFEGERVARRVDVRLYSTGVDRQLHSRVLDGSGAATFEGLAAGSYELYVQLPSGRRIIRPVLELKPGESRRVDVEVSEGAVVRGRLADGLRGDFRVHLGNGVVHQSKRPTIEGRFAFADVSPGRWELLVWDGSTRAFAQTLDLEPGGERVVSVTPGGTFALEGVVVPPEEGAPAGRIVTVTHERLPQLSLRVPRDAAGRFVFRRVPPGSYVLHAFGHDDEWLVDVPRASNAPPLVLEPQR